MTYKLLKENLKNTELIRSNSFNILKQLATLVNKADTITDIKESNAIQELVLLALDKRIEFGNYQPLLDSLIQKRGLYPYLDPNNLNLKELIVYESHRPDGLNNVIFHKVQAEVYRELVRGENLILSAPTSFGKSLIIDALIATKKYKNIVIIVPTIALIDETRRRLSEKFKTLFNIIAHPTQTASSHNIYILTQERANSIEKYPEIDLFILDEFYKLQPEKDDNWNERTKALNLCLLNFMKNIKTKQFYLLGPNISSINIPQDKELNFKFRYTNYSTVAVEQKTILTTKNDEYEKLLDICRNINGQTIIYCASPKQAKIVAETLLLNNITSKTTSSEIIDASNWINEHFHSEWIFSRAILNKIGIHHGQIPRALAHYTLKKFNDEDLKFLICTSTLIEGVNTKAENIIVFNHKTGGKKFDYFTFNNICGRAGRMNQHFIGKVFILKTPPAEESKTVEIPILSRNENIPDSILIHYPEEYLINIEENKKEKLANYKNNEYISLETIKLNSGIEPENQIDLAKVIYENKNSYYKYLLWKAHYPSYEVLEFICTLIWDYLVKSNKREASVSSGKSLARMINILSINGTKGLIFDHYKSSGNINSAIEDTLEFLRHWASFRFPKLLMTLSNIQKDIYARASQDYGNYSYLASKVENLFYPSPLYSLEEYGLPIQIALKLVKELNPNGNLDDLLKSLKKIDIDNANLTLFEHAILTDTIASL